MRITLRRIGNSRGILLPTAVLSVCDVGDEVELSIENGRIIVAPVKASREGWFDDYHADEDENAWGELGVMDADTEDWEW